MEQNLALDFVLSFCKDKIAGHGEDSYCYSFCDTAGMLGVFDGCGGAGAVTHDFYSGHTEAYMASRLCAGAFYDLFRSAFPGNQAAAGLADAHFCPRTVELLRTFAPPREEGALQIKGSGVRTLPSTAAVALMQKEPGGDILVSAIWAGDSRVYILDSRGLAQLTADDTTVPDPMVALYDDGVLRNIFCSDRKVKLHSKTVRMTEPFVVFSATDGCFGFLSTPMEFEGVILDRLLQADSIARWEQMLADVIGAVAGDDHTMCMAGYGYGSFLELQRSFAERYLFLEKNYLAHVRRLPLDDRESRLRLWSSYQTNYMRYIKDDRD